MLMQFVGQRDAVFGGAALERQAALTWKTYALVAQHLGYKLLDAIEAAPSARGWAAALAWVFGIYLLLFRRAYRPWQAHRADK